VGNPNEREREIYYSAFRKVHYSRKTTFPAKESTSQQQICPTKICHVFRAKIVLLYNLLHTSFCMPTISCMSCFVRPRNNNQNFEIFLENHSRNALISMSNPYDCTESYELYRSVQYGLPQKKNILSQKSQNYFS
jgi:hypothetical protein